MSNKRQKFISSLIVFVIIISYFGNLLQAVAASESIKGFANDIMSNSNVEFRTYFDNKKNEGIANVNNNQILTIEVSPSNIGEGFIKDATIYASGYDNTNINFSFLNIIDINVENKEKATIKAEETNDEGKKEELISLISKISNDITVGTSNEVIDNEVVNEISQDENTQDKESTINDEYNAMTAEDYEISIVNNDQIKLKNIIYKTIIKVEIGCDFKDEIYVSDLYKKSVLDFTGIYINTDLESFNVSKKDEISVGWEYTKDINIKSEYTNLSRFKIEQNEGIILEQRIEIDRTIDEEKYLPLKELKMDVSVPKINDTLPFELSVQAESQMASKNLDNDIEFSLNNWKYNDRKEEINIEVSNFDNEKANMTNGKDIYIISYRYNCYIENLELGINNKVDVEVEEYSANKNNIINKNINEFQNINFTSNDLITYNITSQNNSIDKSKINANYNSNDVLYETEFIDTVNVNILTSDIVNELKINCNDEKYVCEDSEMYSANEDVFYKGIMFKNDSIVDILSDNSYIDILDVNGEVINRFDKSMIAEGEYTGIIFSSNNYSITVKFVNLNSNGNVVFDLIKGIGKSQYSKDDLNRFNELMSSISGEISYGNNNEMYQMKVVSTIQKLQKAHSSAEIEMNNNILNTTNINEDVDLKIVLNNNSKQSDLFVNPYFELVFPKYITNIIVNNIGIIYDSNLRIENYNIVKRDENNVLCIKLAGMQTTFNDNDITKGTNILLNLKIQLDEYTPRKSDELKLYYSNEGYTNYGSQTTYLMSNKLLPEICGYDSYSINYQSVAGVIVSNAIINYDGTGSKINSIKQGEKTVQISRNIDSKIATMELAVMNNTESTITESIFMGKIPFENNTSVVTDENLGTTTSVRMMSKIIEKVQNPNMVSIYYSINENPSKDVFNQENGWQTDVEDITKIKSYMIVVKGELYSGNILRFSYDFEIPANLDYDSQIFGSFGGFYNVSSDKLITYESSEADKVGLITEEAPKLELSVYPYGQNYNIYYGQILNLVVKVENKTGNEIVNKNLFCDIPFGTVYTEKRQSWDEMNHVFYEYIDNENIKEKEFIVDSLKNGDVCYYNFDVRVNDSNENRQVLSGKIKFNDTIEEYSFTSRKGNLKVCADVSGKSDNIYRENDNIEYIINIENENKNEIENLVLSSNISKYINIYEVVFAESNNNEYDEYINAKYEIKNNNLIVGLGNIEKKYIKVIIKCNIQELSVEDAIIENIFNVYSEGQSGLKYSSNKVEFKAKKAFINVIQEINKNEFAYGDDFTYSVTINNNSSTEENITVYVDLLKNIHIEDSKIDYLSQIEKIDFSNSIGYIAKISGFSTMKIICNGKIRDWGNQNEELVENHIAKVQLSDGEIISSNNINVKINKNEDIVIDENKKHRIAGNIFVDNNENGIRDNEDSVIKSIAEVKLLQNSNVIETVNTNESGEYIFEDIENGNYSIVINYDNELYKTPLCAKNGNSLNVVNVESGKAITDEFTVNNTNIENLNLGIYEQDRFDLKVDQYIEEAVINTNGNIKKYEFDDLELAKLEIDPSEIDNSNVQLTYKIVVTNVGNVTGQATSLVNYIPNGMIYNQNENRGWVINAKEGNIYYNGLSGINIAPGESKEIELVLNKNMTEDNTGIISNKIVIAYSYNDMRVTEVNSNNFASQETVVTLTQGSNRKPIISVIISFVIIASIFSYFKFSDNKYGRIRKSIKLRKFYK